MYAGIGQPKQNFTEQEYTGAVREPQVMFTLMQLEKEHEQLTVLVEELGGRLGPILDQTPHPEKNPIDAMSQPEPPLCDLADRIRSNMSRVRHQNQRLTDLLRRIEL